MFTGCGTAMVTPFRGDGSLDEATLRKLVRRQIEQGIDFLVPCGTTGESPTLSRDEHLRVVAITIEESAKKVPVLAGAGGYNTREVVELARECQRLGADGILSVTPYYNKPTQEGLYRHFRAIAEAADIPLILYNVPSRTVADLANDTVVRLAQVPRIVGLKESTSSIERVTDLLARVPKGFMVFSGNDDAALAYALLGARGVISVTANVAPRLMHEMMAQAGTGEREKAIAINNRLLPLHRTLFVEANPIPVKWALHRMGRIAPGLRLPLTPLSSQYHETVAAALRAAGCLS
jgi:4-hydroxy-tetrahydrodipicolinate synthase